MKRFTILALLLAAFLGVVISPFASSWLDGLERVAEDHGFLSKGEGEPLLAAPFADYAFPGVAHEKLATAAAGGIGTLIVFGLGLAAAAVIRRKS